MKTETVNNEKWNYEVNYEGREDNPICDILDSSLPYFKKPLAKVAKEKDAELIVTAVNACKEINKDNPLQVAKLLSEYFEAVNNLLKEVSPHIHKLTVKKGFSELVALEGVKTVIYKMKLPEQVMQEEEFNETNENGNIIPPHEKIWQ